MEKIVCENGVSDAWLCICKNTPSGDGFYPCDSHGNELEPVIGGAWDEKSYACHKCGRIIDQATLEVTGWCGVMGYFKRVQAEYESRKGKVMNESYGDTANQLTFIAERLANGLYISPEYLGMTLIDAHTHLLEADRLEK